MASRWIRSHDDSPAPSTRAVVIRYSPSAPENSELERLLAQIPYGLTNKTWLECLRAGAKAMLRKLDQEAAQTKAAQEGQRVGQKLAETQRLQEAIDAAVAAALPKYMNIKAPSPPSATETPSRSAAREAPAPLPSDGKEIQTKDEPAAPAAPAEGFSKAAQRMFDS